MGRKYYFNPSTGEVQGYRNEIFTHEITDNYYPVFDWTGKYLGVMKNKVFIERIGCEY